MTSNYHYLLKYIIVGDSGVGKSNILLQFVHNKFKKDHEVTIGVEFGAKNVYVNEKTFKIQIWDTAGQEKFKSITRAYFKSSVCAFLVYDITNLESFLSVQNWINECRAQCPSTAILYLIGNKVDLENQRQVTYDSGSELADKNKMKFFETSAKELYNIDETFIASVIDIDEKIAKSHFDLKSDVSNLALIFYRIAG